MKMSNVNKFIKKKLTENPNGFFMTHNPNAVPMRPPVAPVMRPNVPAIQNTIAPAGPTRFTPPNALPPQIANPIQNVMPQQATPLAPTFRQNVMNKAGNVNTAAHNAVNTGVNYAQQTAQNVIANPTVQAGVNHAVGYGTQAAGLAAAHPYVAGVAAAGALGTGVYNYIQNRKHKR